MKTFISQYNSISADLIREKIYSRSEQDVENALVRKKRSLDDFIAMISPAAMPYLEEMARLSHLATKRRFGKTIQMYNPLYLSNECSNCCTYCGFNHTNKIERLTLNEDQILNEALALKNLGYEHILLVTGESDKKAGFKYLKRALEIVKPHFSLVSMEVQPLSEDEYRELVSIGLNTVYIYQETYQKQPYQLYHPAGKKADFLWRLETPDRLGRAGAYKIGLGVLLGLEDWRIESFYLASHISWLEKNYWKSKYSVSFPRLRPAKGVIEPKYPVSDKELVQLICAYRLFNEELELSISTRESEKFRNNIIKLGITSMSAGSKTNPGGYTLNNNSLEQFHIADERSPDEIAAMIKSQGYEVVWKDWDSVLQ